MFYYVTPFRGQMRRHMMHQMHENRWNEEAFEYRLPIEVKMDADKFQIRAIIPGIKSDDLDIQIVGDQVTISGEFKSEEGEGTNFLARELPEGKFTRSFTLPEQLNPMKAEAKLVDGILTLSIPKAEEAKPKTIKVNAK